MDVLGHCPNIPFFQNPIFHHLRVLDSEAEGNLRPLILIVDDDASTRNITIRFIKALGFGVLACSDGIEALQLIRRFSPDLILTDALMPRLGGFELCRSLKLDPSTSAIKVIIMSASYTRPRHQTEARKFSVDECISKPVTPGVLESVLQKHLG
jgi:CheY-like chemotaxis protein